MKRIGVIFGMAHVHKSNEYNRMRQGDRMCVVLYLLRGSGKYFDIYGF